MMKHNNIILHREKVIFFLVAKAANSSIKAAIKMLYNIPPDPDTLHRDWNRVSPAEAAMVDYSKIAVVRNPFDRLVSCYYQKILGRGKSGLLNLNGIYQGMSFTDFVKQIYHIKSMQEAHIRPQHVSMIHDGALVPQIIIRFEQLETEWANIVQKIIPGMPDLPHMNSSDHPKYQYCLGDQEKQMTTELYQKDLELIGYEF